MYNAFNDEDFLKQLDELAKQKKDEQNKRFDSQRTQGYNTKKKYYKIYTTELSKIKNK